MVKVTITTPTNGQNYNNNTYNGQVTITTPTMVKVTTTTPTMVKVTTTPIMVKVTITTPTMVKNEYVLICMFLDGRLADTRFCIERQEAMQWFHPTSLG